MPVVLTEIEQSLPSSSSSGPSFRSQEMHNGSSNDTGTPVSTSKNVTRSSSRKRKQSLSQSQVASHINGSSGANTGIFVAVAISGTNRVITSTDGITWTARRAAQQNSWISIAHGNGVYVAVASDGTYRVMTSTDGITWTAQSAAEQNPWKTIGNQ